MQGYKVMSLIGTSAARFSARAALFAGLTLAAATATAADTATKIQRYDVQSAGLNAGAAKTIVNAPEQVVRGVVTDFGRYDTFISRFRAAKIVGRVGDKTDVYLQVPIMKGTVKIWGVVRFDPPKPSGNDQVITGKLVQGNVKRLDAVWRIRKVSAEQTELRLELLIVPQLPLPDSMVLPELRNAAAKAVDGSRNEAERRRATL